jgi:ABC-type phosphate/phosphonate transport system permease subunit
LTSVRITCTLHEDLHIFMIISSSILLSMKNFSDSSCSWNQNTNSFFNTFFQKSCSLWDNVDKHGRAGQATDDNTVELMCITCWITKAANLDYVILIAFHGNSGFMNVLQCYVTHTLPLLLDSEELTKDITCHSFYCFYCYNLVFLCEKTVFLKEAF